MSSFRSVRQVAQHLAASGSDVTIVKRQPARRNPQAGAAVAISNRRQAHPEHDEQVRLVNWVRKHEEEIPALKLFHSVPNGGFRSKRTAALMKAEGALAGVPDLFLPCPRWWPDGSVSHGLYIEMKAAKGRLSIRQQEIIALLREQEYRVVVCYSAEAAIYEICRYIEAEPNL